MAGISRGLFASALVLAVLSYGLLKQGGNRTHEVGQSIDGRAAQILSKIGVPFPTSAKAEYAKYEVGLDDNARVILLMPAAEWSKVETALFRNASGKQLFSTENQLYLGSNEGDWSPRSDPELTAAQIPWNDGKEIMNIGVSNAGSDLVRVYLFWHQL